MPRSSRSLIWDGIDTDDRKVRKAQCQLHGMLDDLLLDAIADHCREGLIGLFKQGYVTGALSVGYRPVVAPGAPATRRGKPRTMPAVDEKVADLIRQHFELIRSGMPITEGLRRWRSAGGPCDPRSTTRTMSYQAYVRLLKNSRYTGRWEFGRMRNTWSSFKDYTRQIPQPDSEVHTYLCEELRIISDDLYLAVQQRLREQKSGPRGPRTPKEPRLHDLVTDVFRCPHCQRRFHTCGARGQAMRCPNLDCPTPAIVGREEAVAAVGDTLTELVARDHDLTERIQSAAHQQSSRSDEEVEADMAELKRKIRTKTNQIEDLTELAGQGSDDDRQQLMAKVRTAQAERTAFQLELTRLQDATRVVQAVSSDQARRVLADFGQLLEEAASGTMGPDAAYKAADIFRRLVGGVVWVHVDARAGRKRASVRGRFTPRLLSVVADTLGVSGLSTEAVAGEVEVCLRRVPRLDAIAAEVCRLYEEEGLGFRAIAKRLRIGCGNIYQSYLRYDEMQGLPVPPRRPRGRLPGATARRGRRGISVAGAVDVARDAAEIILLERSLRVLHTGIIEGRKAFGNVMKYLLMGTSSNFGNMFSMAVGTLFLPFLSMLPIQILLNNFLYDLAQLTILTDHVDASFTHKPRRWDIAHIRNFMLAIGPISSLYDFLTFAALLTLFRGSEELFHTGWFVESLATQTLVLFVIRTANNPLKSWPSPALTMTVLLVVLAGVLLPFTPLAGVLGLVPLPSMYFMFLVCVTSTYLVVVELVKRRLLRRFLD